MLEKHKLKSEKEVLIYSPEMVKNEWLIIYDTFEKIIEGGWTNNSILNLINYLSSSKYAEELFPSSSMGTLLISKPINGRLNFQKTLSISYNSTNNKFKLSYSNWDILESKEDLKKAILWEIESETYQLNEKFDEFINWNNNWN